MAVSKVILNSTTLMDATTATAAASDITAPKTAMLADGVMTQGTGGSVSGYGDPYTMTFGSSNYFAVGGVNYLFLDVSNAGKRRSVWASSGEDSANLYVSSSNYQNSADVYPIPVPSGRTKVSVAIDVSNQAAILSLSHSNGWAKLGDTGWLNPPINEYSFPTGTTHFAIGLRVDSNNSSYAYSNQPKTVEITFS